MLYNAHEYIDHLGNKFPSEKDLLKHYNVARTTFHRQLKKNKSIKEILTNYSRKSLEVTDHNGQVFSTLTEMLNHYKIADAVYRRDIKNMSLKQVLTKNRKNVKDHLGKNFKTRKEMCEYWHISVNCFKRRMSDNWPLGRALTEPMHRPNSLPKYMQEKSVTDHLIIKKYLQDS